MIETMTPASHAQSQPLRPRIDVLDIMGVDVVSATACSAIAMLDTRLAAGEHIRLAFMNAHGSNLAASISR